MEHLWTPWRSTYMKSSKQASGCIFCDAISRDEDKETLIAYRGQHTFVILNRYPYTSGHLMIAPYAHISSLNEATQEALDEMMSLTRQAERVLAEGYHPDGMNLGMNLGRAAGAGIADHIHLHVLPRWNGDANFMTTVADTRIIPESLDDTYSKIKQGFAG